MDTLREHLKAEWSGFYQACGHNMLKPVCDNCRHSETSSDHTPMSALTSPEKPSTLCGTLVTLLTPSHLSLTIPRCEVLQQPRMQSSIFMCRNQGHSLKAPAGMIFLVGSLF